MVVTRPFIALHVLFASLSACGESEALPSAETSAPAPESHPSAGATPQAGQAPASGTLASCFPDTLGDVAAARMPSGMRGPFARAYLAQDLGGRSININVWDEGPDNLEGQLTQYPVIGQAGVQRAGSGSERVGGSYHERPSEAMWETLSGGRHRDSFAVRVSETRLVWLAVQSDPERGEAEMLFGELDFACLQNGIRPR